jgi:hypothetical protein
MKVLIWSVFGCLTLLWTGAAFAVVALVRWAAGWLGAGALPDLNAVFEALALPAWLTHWFDLGDISALFEGLRWVLEALQGTAPEAAAVVQWLVPATWVVWGLGMLLMLALSAGLHALVSKASPARPPAQKEPSVVR